MGNKNEREYRRDLNRGVVVLLVVTKTEPQPDDHRRTGTVSPTKRRFFATISIAVFRTDPVNSNGRRRSTRAIRHTGRHTLPPPGYTRRGHVVGVRGEVSTRVSSENRVWRRVGQKNETRPAGRLTYAAADVNNMAESDAGTRCARRRRAPPTRRLPCRTGTSLGSRSTACIHSVVQSTGLVPLGRFCRP